MHPALARRATWGQAWGWARCPRFAPAELSASVSPAGLGAPAILMALAMSVTGPPGSKAPLGWERSPPTPCEHPCADVALSPALGPGPGQLRGGIGSEQRQPGGMRGSCRATKARDAGQHRATHLMVPLRTPGFTPEPKPLAAEPPHSQWAASPARPEGVPGQGHLSSIPEVWCPPQHLLSPPRFFLAIAISYP